MKKFILVAMMLAAQFVNAETNFSDDCTFIMKNVAGQTELDYFVKQAVHSCKEAPTAHALQIAIEQAKVSQSSSKQFELMQRLAARHILLSEMSRNGVKLKNIKMHSRSFFADNGDGAGQYDFNELTTKLGVDRLEYRAFREELSMQEPDGHDYEYLQYNHLKVLVSLTSYLYETVFP